MLIIQRMELMKLSANEDSIRQFILENTNDLDKMTIKQIASHIFVSPASLIVFAKKLGYSGWNEFKKDFIDEKNYLDSHFQKVDPNTPFTQNDNIMKIAHKIATLQNETIQDTLALVHHDSLQKAIQILKKSSCLYIYGTSMSYMAVQEFAFSMKRLGVHVEYCTDSYEQVFQAQVVPSNSSALIVSYTGETEHIIKVCEILKQKNIPIITITGFGENSAKQYSDAALYMSTRENVHSKINSYSTRQSIHTLLDILYSCYFSLHYQTNYKKIIEINKNVELKRFSTNVYINK